MGRSKDFCEIGCAVHSHMHGSVSMIVGAEGMC